MTAREHIEFLAGSEHRVRLLSVLQEPKRPGGLVDEQSASRATVQRALSGFTERGWVRKETETGCYQLTTAGKLVYESYHELVDVVDTVEKASESLSLLESVEPDIPIEAVRTASMTVSSPKNPHAAMDRYFTALDDSGTDIDHLYGISPILSPVLNEAHKELIESGVPTELIIDEDTFETIKNTDAESTNDSFSVETFTLYVFPGSIGFGLGIVGNQVFVSAYDDLGRQRANLHGTDDALVEWAQTVYDRYRREARVIEAV
jgi:predicted transcriptional regulator